MSGVLDKIRKMKEREPVRGGFTNFRGIFHAWKDADNLVRLVGEFIEVKTHFVSPNPKRGERGLCQAKAFQGNNRIPQTVNCLDWDVAKEEPTKLHTCPFCKLNAIAKQALKENPTADEKKFFDALKQSAYARTALKWHIIDRDDPFVLKLENGTEIKVPGLKIATLGLELWKDIEGIFNQCGFDISDLDEGIDICVTKTTAAKTAYAAKAVLFGRPPTVKVTPLSPEERAFERHDLKAICGKQTSLDALMDALHGDLRELLDLNSSDEAAVPEQEPAAAAAAAAHRAPAVHDGGDDADALAGEEDDGLGGLAPMKGAKKN